MRGLKKKRRIQVIGLAFVALAVATGLIGYAMRDGINFFRGPSEIADAPPPESELFRLGGQVAGGSLQRAGTQVSFDVTDGAVTIPVHYVGILPDLFEECQMMIGQGRLVSGTFEAVEILAKHDENYQPKEAVNAMTAEVECTPANGR